MLKIIKSKTLELLKEKINNYENNINLLKSNHKEYINSITEMRICELKKAFELFKDEIDDYLSEKIDVAAESKKTTIEVPIYTDDIKAIALEIKNMKSKNINVNGEVTTFYLVDKKYIEKILK